MGGRGGPRRRPTPARGRPPRSSAMRSTSARTARTRPSGRAAQALADVPVGGVEDPHAGERRLQTLERVAAGVGGHLLLAGRPGREGERDDERHRDRGLRHDHGARLQQPVRGREWTGSIQPYSARSASAASSRPLMRIAAFSGTSGATRLAVCWAPTAARRATGRAARCRRACPSAGSALARRVLVELVQNDER